MRRGIVAREHAPEVLGHEMTVGQDHEAVVGSVARQLAGGEHAEIGREPVRVVAEHDVERAVRVRGEPAGPRGTTGEVVGARERFEGDRIDPLYPHVRVGPERVAQQEHLARRPQHDHGRRANLARRDLHTTRFETGTVARDRDLQPPGPAVFAGPARGPVAGRAGNRFGHRANLGAVT